MNPSLQQLLSGKRLLLSEIPVLEKQLPHPHVQSEPGIQLISGRETCMRCGNCDRTLFGQHPCAKCGQICRYCRHCIQLGKISQCQMLYHWSGPELEMPSYPNSLHWQGRLSSGQKTASDAVIKAIARQQQLLVWAV